jgi:hypothetical protein
MMNETSNQTLPDNENYRLVYTNVEENQVVVCFNKKDDNRENCIQLSKTISFTRYLNLILFVYLS